MLDRQLKITIFLSIIIFMLISCSAGSGNETITKTNQVNQSFNFKTLTPQNTVFNIPESVCPNIQIWNRESSLMPPQPQCSVTTHNNSNIAYGCNIESGNLTNLLKQSVVDIFIPLESDNIWKASCTGTVIDKHWILTAAHCFADSKKVSIYQESSIFNAILEKYPVYIVPWQAAYNGIPEYITTSTPVIKFEAKAVYIPYHYSYFGESFTPPYPGYLKEDFALVEIAESLPDNYQAIALRSESITLPPEAQLWQAGYGNNQNLYNNSGQTSDGQLHYHTAYYMSDIFDDTPYHGKVIANLGQIYTLGTLPEIYNGRISAWSFPGSGDSGGPQIYFDHRQAYIAGITSGVPCVWAGFFAPLPYPYNYNASVAYYHDFILSIMNGSAPESATRCISSSGGCNPNILYVLNQQSNSISLYKIDQNQQLSWWSDVHTGIYPSSILLSKESRYGIVVSNSNPSSNNGSISQYINTINGMQIPAAIPQIAVDNNPVDLLQIESTLLTANLNSNSISLINGNKVIQSVPTGNQPTSLTTYNIYRWLYIMETLDTLVYITNYADNSISIYEFDHWSKKLLPIDSDQLDAKVATGNGPVKIKFSPQGYAYVLNQKDSTISIYKSESTGYLTLIHTISPPLPFATDPSDIIFTQDNSFESHPKNHYAYVTNTDSNTVTQFKLESDGNLSYIGYFPTGLSPRGEDIDKKGEFLYVADSGSDTVTQFKIAPDTGNLTVKDIINTGNKPVAVKVTN